MTVGLNLSGRRRLELVRQSETAECGLACLAMIASYHGQRTDMSSLRRRFDTSMKGTTLRTLIDIGNAMGLASRAVRCELQELRNVQLPAVLHWGGNHFVVLEAVRASRLVILDPSGGRRSVGLGEASRGFTGVALELAPTPAFQPRRDRNPLKLSSLVRLPPDVRRGLVQSLVLSVLIEVLLLASPFYVQLVIDDAVVKGDGGFLRVLALAFALILVFKVAATAVRSLTLQFVSQSLTFDMKTRLFHHLLRLPLEWFHKRAVGDIQSRFLAIQPIQSFIANGAISGSLDGILGTLVLVLMFFYSAALTAIAMASVLAYVVLRVTLLHLQRRFAGDAIVTQAVEQTRFLEAVRAIETVKAAGAETMKGGQQRNAVAAAINSVIRGGNLKIAYDGAAALIDGLTDVLVVYVGARSIIGGNMTVGMLTAFLAYRQQFASRLTGFVEQVVGWRMLTVDLDRLSDVALTPAEARVDGGVGYEGLTEGAIRCRGLAFRYAYGEPHVLRRVDLDIGTGEHVAIVGTSGCGKTTLLKLLVGLYTPSAGEVLVDGRPLSHWSLRAIRRQVAMVTQDDKLLAGSIAENISLFDEGVDMERVRRCATAAQIHTDVSAMPMGYETLVGDMGSSLSGGQRQRVVIARALYRQPRILIMDEGTSHLDVPTERAVNEALQTLEVTRLVVAHRPETIRCADRVLRLHGGEIVEERRVEDAVL